MSIVRTLSIVLAATLVVGVVGAPGPAHAQSDSDTTTAERPPALQRGGWGLQYEATSLDGALSGFQGSVLAGRYHFSSQSALRVGVTLDVTSGDRDLTQSDPGEQPPEPTTEKRETTSQEYGLFGQYLRYFAPTDRIFVFVGAGPRAGIARETETRTTIQRDADPGGNVRTFTAESDQEETIYRVGLGGTVGVEWYVHDHLSLSVEYPLRVDYIHTDIRETQKTFRNGNPGRTRKLEGASDEYVFGGESVRIGLTFSFGP